jgi:DNA helicase TIP49 (TBP-interacting protein)
MPNTKEPSSTPSMSSFVRIRQSGLRSVNVERDLQSCPIADGYVLTAQARACLSRIMGGLTSGTYTRAWTLTGPYGSGKSYFGLFLMNLFGKDQPAHQIVLNQ